VWILCWIFTCNIFNAWGLSVITETFSMCWRDYWNLLRLTLYDYHFLNCVLSSRAIENIHCFKITYLLTPWCRVLPEQLTGLQLVKKFPSFHGTRRFITALTSVRHPSLSWTSPIQSIYPHPTSWRSILILFKIITQ
jgi:hypothetical protein